MAHTRPVRDWDNSYADTKFETAFNFSHQINELSFGPFYPSLLNPLDNTRTTTDKHFYKYQYYLSVVPTIYTTSPRELARMNPSVSPSSSDEANEKTYFSSTNTVFTNQYAVTEQSHIVSETAVPGIFVKFDIEPILLTIAEEWDSPLGLLVRLVNVVSGVLVAGGWCYQLSEWARDVAGRRGRRRADSSMGVLHGRRSLDEKDRKGSAYGMDSPYGVDSPASPYGMPMTPGLDRRVSGGVPGMDRRVSGYGM